MPPQKPPALRKVPIHKLDQIEKQYDEPDDEFEFITITLLPYLYKRTAQSQFVITYHELVSYLNCFCRDYCMVAEITKDGNVHYHGWVVWERSQSFMTFSDSLKHANHYFGFVYKTKLKDGACKDVQRKRMREYMLKDIRTTYRMIRSVKILFNKQEITNTVIFLNTPSLLDDGVDHSLMPLGIQVIEPDNEE